MFGKKSDNWLIVGLGNPGKEYERTRHNAGFRAIDVLAESLGCKVDKGKFQGLYGQCNYNGIKLYLLKPLTYMNLSGQSVLQLSAGLRRIFLLRSGVRIFWNRLHWFFHLHW